MTQATTASAKMSFVMSDDSFARLVADDVKNKVTPGRRQTLHQPENWDRWKRALLALVQNLEEQLEDIDIDAESDAKRYLAMGRDGQKLAKTAAEDYELRKARISKFLFHVNKRLDQVVAMIEGVETEVYDEWDTAEIYRRAIREHKRLMVVADLDPTPIDEALWDTLNHKWTLDSVRPESIMD